MKHYNVTLLNRKGYQCSLCDMYQSLGVAPLCPDHEKECMEAFGDGEQMVGPQDLDEKDYTLTDDDQNHYFGVHYGDMEHFENVELTSLENN